MPGEFVQHEVGIGTAPRQRGDALDAERTRVALRQVRLGGSVREEDDLREPMLCHLPAGVDGELVVERVDADCRHFGQIVHAAEHRVSSTAQN